LVPFLEVLTLLGRTSEPPIDTSSSVEPVETIPLVPG
jgi:hypothetical protein